MGGARKGAVAGRPYPTDAYLPFEEDS